MRREEPGREDVRYSMGCEGCGGARGTGFSAARSCPNCCRSLHSAPYLVRFDGLHEDGGFPFLSLPMYATCSPALRTTCTRCAQSVILPPTANTAVETAWICTMQLSRREVHLVQPASHMYKVGAYVCIALLVTAAAACGVPHGVPFAATHTCWVHCCF